MKHKFTMFFVLLLSIHTLTHANGLNGAEGINSLLQYINHTNSNVKVNNKEIELLIPTNLTRVTVTGEEIYYQESKEVIPYTIKTDIENISQITVLLQNRKTLKNTLVAKYTLSSEFSGQLSGRFKQRCNNKICRLYVAVVSDKHVHISSKLIGNSIVH